MDERSSASGQKAAEQYLGMLYTLEDAAIYGFQTSTRVRFLLMLTLTDHVIRDLDILTLFRALHTAYLHYAANPFHMLPLPASAVHESSDSAASASAVLQLQQDIHIPVNCRPIRSVAFDRTVDRIVSRGPGKDRLNRVLPSTPQTGVAAGAAR